MEPGKRGCTGVSLWIIHLNSGLGIHSDESSALSLLSRATVGMRSHHGGMCFPMELVQNNNVELWWGQSRGSRIPLTLSLTGVQSIGTHQDTQDYFYFSSIGHMLRNPQAYGLYWLLIILYLGTIFEKLCSLYFIFPNNSTQYPSP